MAHLILAIKELLEEIIYNGKGMLFKPSAAQAVLHFKHLSNWRLVLLQIH